MSRLPRCLVADLHDPRLDAGSRHHLSRVLRLRRDDPLELVDGRGGLARFRWADGERPVLERMYPPLPAPDDPLWLAVAPPRPARLDWLVEKAAELGVERLLLLDTAHAVRGVAAPRLERLQRKADEALLQCRLLHRLQLQASRPLSQVIAESRAAELWVAEAPPDIEPGEAAGQQAAGAKPEPADGAQPQRRAGRPLLLVVGPEGGLAPAESAALQAAGARRLQLGRAVLRVETAAMALAARLMR